VHQLFYMLASGSRTHGQAQTPCLPRRACAAAISRKHQSSVMPNINMSCKTRLTSAQRCSGRLKSRGRGTATRRHVCSQQEWHCLPGRDPTARNRCLSEREPAAETATMLYQMSTWCRRGLPATSRQYVSQDTPSTMQLTHQTPVHRHKRCAAVWLWSCCCCASMHTPSTCSDITQPCCVNAPFDRAQCHVHMQQTANGQFRCCVLHLQAPPLGHTAPLAAMALTE
jgi:hypothetical protein